MAISGHPGNTRLEVHPHTTMEFVNGRRLPRLENVRRAFTANLGKQTRRDTLRLSV